ncbi:hypothetical protein [Chryseobacterium sp. Leaf394]|uniref:hypothetical protein n=1 Tax=Chryseobacterium sp. Leaf394 TaxID=1736361 RepID=UPI000A6588B0|nr:hypothetical protein [Chryseobacterium sp. Leaf394]
MNAYYYLFSIIMLTLSCNSKSQDLTESGKGVTKINEKKMTVKIFNIPEYEKKLKANPDYIGYKTKENVEVKQNYMLDDQHFGGDYNPKYVIEYLHSEKFPDGFTDSYIFNKDGFLTEYERYFDDIETGIWKKYLEGKIVSQENKDINYPFSIDDVILFSKKNNGDLSKSGSFKRSYDDQQKIYIYTIEWVVKNVEKPYTQGFVLNGGDGKIIKTYRKDSPRIKM